MLYTIVPPETVYQVKIPNPTIHEIDGIKLEMRADMSGAPKFSRLISTDLSDYLKY